MTTRIARWIAAPAVVALLAVPGRADADQRTRTLYPYVLVDLGTLGGPQDGQGNGPYLSNTGMVAGTADTATHDPYYPSENSAFNEDPYIQHTFLWRNSVLGDLGALPGTGSSYPNGINVRADEAGVSDNGVINPLTHLPEVVAILWRGQRIISLGTLGGNESAAFALNDLDQVTGVAQNAIPDPVSMLGLGGQIRAFLWQDGAMRDLGTLGGPDAFGWFLNDRGQVAGVSYTNATVNPLTGQPQTDPFLWQDGQMRDLGTLGGSVPTFGGVSALNIRGEVVGLSDLAGDQIFHPYLWDGNSMVDLGTLGGDYGNATAINDLGVVAGWAQPPGNSTVHAVLWWNGARRDLGLTPGDGFSFANAVNQASQVVGDAGACDSSGCVVHGFLWQHGTIVDINTLAAPSDLYLTDAISINDRGEIVGYGALPDGNEHQILLIPADEAARDGVTANAPAPDSATPALAPRRSAATCATMLGHIRPAPWHATLAHQDHLRCLGI